MKVLLSWSSGKDSAWALHVLRQQAGLEIAGLITTINSAFDRVAMHSTRRSLVEMQAAAAGLPLVPVPLPWPCSNADYECAMKAVCDQAVADGVSAIAFGDLFLADIRAYRERQLANTGLEPLFPLWQIPTDELAREMISSGLKARLVCVDPKKLHSGFAGREFDEQLLRDLPGGVDPCGENGEFHTFAYAGPMFSHPIRITAGERVQRDGFWFADLAPGGFPSTEEMQREDRLR
ncbi:MAG TPA: ATP-binding protein [Candidatus Angelobacter sp.]|jgi:uncharacterized protein (TIGR00290 family)|nr:ATP-binding protein [Candidatus Angelobacter sp.]